MIADTYIAWIATAAFAVTGIFWLWQGFRRGGTAVTYLYALFHVLMAVGMLVMLWPSWPQPSTVLGMVVFAVATLFFLGLLLFRRDHRLSNAYHAAMMGSMVWMYALMNPSIVPMSMGDDSMGEGSMDMSSHAGHAGHAGHSGMDMPGHASMDVPGWASTVNLVLGIAYLVVTAITIALFYRGRATADEAILDADADGAADHTHGHRLTAAMQATMAFGMGITFLSVV